MPACPACARPTVHGQILCPHCGADLDEAVTFKPLLPVVAGSATPSWDEPTIELHVIHAYGEDFARGTFAAVIPYSNLEMPLRIGRADTRQHPPIRPELDLTALLEPRRDDACPHTVSRLHAALQMEGGRPAIKPLSERANATWIRHTRGTSVLTLLAFQPHRLRHRDVIILGPPGGLHVELRVMLREPR